MKTSYLAFFLLPCLARRDVSRGKSYTECKKLDRAISEPLSERIDDLARRFRVEVDRTVRD